jgi:hypothetical protein
MYPGLTIPTVVMPQILPRPPDNSIDSPATAHRRAGNQHRTISTYLTALLAAGFALTAIAEPMPDPGVVGEQPQRASLPPFLLIVGRTANM